MLGHRELNAQDYLDVLRRRGVLIACCAAVFLAVGIGATYLVPPQYVSQTLVIIEQQKVPESYVKPVVAEDMNERLASMKEQIFSRSRIQPIVESFNLFAGGKVSMDDRIDLTRKAIEVKPIPSARGTMPGFFITFRARDPHTAQRVCGEIESLFASENLNAREQISQGTTEFLKQQLDEAKRVLDEQDAKLAAFQRRHSGNLPEQGPSNANTLQALTAQLDAATQSVGRAQQNVTFIDALLSQQSRDQQPGGVAAVSVDERRAELKALLKQKQELEAMFTPEHPDVLGMARRISDLEESLARSPAQSETRTAAVEVATDTAEMKQLRAQLRAAQQTLATAREDQAAVQQRIRTYEARIESRPMVEEEYKQITRDHETALQFYKSLLNKMNESSMATALERRQQGEHFRIMDPPNLPQSPAFPNRYVFAGGGFVFGVMVGFLIACVLEYRDTTLRRDVDVSIFLKLPTLATISHIDGLEPDAATTPQRGRGPFTGLMSAAGTAGD